MHFEWKNVFTGKFLQIIYINSLISCSDFFPLTLPTPPTQILNYSLYMCSLISFYLLIFSSSVLFLFCFFLRVLFPAKVDTQAAVQTFASPTFSSFLDMLLCSSVFLALSLACFLRPLVTQQSLSTPALILTSVAALLEALALMFAIRWDTECRVVVSNYQNNFLLLEFGVIISFKGKIAFTFLLHIWNLALCDICIILYT